MLFILLISLFLIPIPDLHPQSTLRSFSESWSVDWGCSEVLCYPSHEQKIQLPWASPVLGARETPVGDKSWCVGRKGIRKLKNNDKIG